MYHEVQGVVALGRGRPVSLETVLVPDPGPGEALVRTRPARMGRHARPARRRCYAPSSRTTGS